MGMLWFWIVAVMLAAYVVLDGFDLGVGAVMLLVAHTDEERKQAYQSIGPVWDGNEVWLLAAGGTLFFAFPLLYASAFSGFYMPLMIVLWLLILRGLSVELRGHVHDEMWHSFWDVVFTFSSGLLIIFFGAALANVIRGVPIGPDSYFYLSLWTNWRTGANPGILDWYTVLGGVLALLALSLHGSLYLALKTEGDLHDRCYALAKRLGPAVVIGCLVSIPATVIARPNSLANYEKHPAEFLAPVTVAICLVLLPILIHKGDELRAFLTSCALLIAMLCGAAAGLYPVLLPSTLGSQSDITMANALAGPHSLKVGLVWWSIGIVLAGIYFTTVYWLFRGKVSSYSDTYGH
ncbi:cytochrome bd-I ubiquinol oxidase subunit 2 apoprotein [Bryocella elongata]|uniref:Cytochrome bd-I ubiquinol oxidase subunit 2 apoprotein n=1 Tax=Bryocella elongata TaxID=863522 RepID=A0A1H5UC86_9BACT|nr:cytochrome d ubiquinol oxidase subunit II [Bryocella elongata]SEF71857.1 cytochrome bd-I ubiquinol oxidase subunit 2 apoprotein [Bryocella elongata]